MKCVLRIAILLNSYAIISTSKFIIALLCDLLPQLD